MKKHVITVCILMAYSAILIEVMVFKNIPTLKIGHLMLNFAGTETGHPANFVPFKTIVPYLLGYKGLIIAGVNLVGNILPLVPIGFLFPFVYRGMTWKWSLALAVVSGLSIEVLQVVLRVGIFDIDDVILNALGVMIGYGAFVVLAAWVSQKRYLHILTAVLVCLAAAGGAFYFVYPWGQPVQNPTMDVQGAFERSSKQQETQVPQSGDLCGGTGGNGQIVRVENGTIVMLRNDGTTQIVTLIDGASIHTPEGLATVSDLKIGDRMTLVGGPNPDGSFTAEAVFICSAQRK